MSKSEHLLTRKKDCPINCTAENSSTNEFQKRTRKCQNGDTCPGEAEEKRECGTSICSWSEWGEWALSEGCTVCNVEGATKNRSRNCDEKGKCPGEEEQTSICENECVSDCCDKVRMNFRHIPNIKNFCEFLIFLESS